MNTISVPKFFYFKANKLRPRAKIAAHFDGEKNIVVQLNHVDFPDFGSKWVDIIGGPGNLIFVSEKVAESIHASNLKGVELIDIAIGNIENKRMRELGPKKIFLLNVTGRINIDTKIARSSYDSYNSTQHFVPSSDSNMNFDFMLLNNDPIPISFCSRKVVDLARKDRWSNLATAPMDILRSQFFIGKDKFRIDYLGKKWPPQWYPEGYEPHPNNLEEVDDLPSPRS